MRLFLIILFFGLNVAASEPYLPTYNIDLSFITQPSLLKKGTPKQVDEYNKKVTDKTLYPVFAQEVYLVFGNKKVRAYIIASNHENEKDVEFIEANLKKFSNLTNQAHLFIEQGDSFSPEGGATQFIDLINQKTPSLLPAIKLASSSKFSFLNPKFMAASPFTIISKNWQSQGRDYSNFDLSMNFSLKATEFLLQNVEPQIALRFFRRSVFSETLNFLDFKTFITASYNVYISQNEVADFVECGGTVDQWLKLVVQDNQIANLVRERYMRLNLYKNIKDGDVIIAHPVHIRHILNPELLNEENYL